MSQYEPLRSNVEGCSSPVHPVKLSKVSHGCEIEARGQSRSDVSLFSAGEAFELWGICATTVPVSSSFKNWLVE